MDADGCRWMRWDPVGTRGDKNKAGRDRNGHADPDLGHMAGGNFPGHDVF